MSTIKTERLTKILSETQAVISECNLRGVHGSVEVNARLFENVLMELLWHRAAMLHGADGNSPVIPDGWVLVPVELTCEMDEAAWNVCHGTRTMSDIWSALLAAAPQQEGAGGR